MEATDRDREILETLAELGLEVASALKQRIIVAEDAESADGLSLAFTRVSRVYPRHHLAQTLTRLVPLATLSRQAGEG